MECHNVALQTGPGKAVSGGGVPAGRLLFGMPFLDTRRQRAALLIIVLGFGLAYALWPFSSGLMGALVLYVVFGPAYHGLVRRGFRPGLAAGVIVLFALVLVVGPGISFIGLVANEAQGMAARAAADEARSRAGTREVFLNIARRSQGIAYQQLKILDQAQEHVEDPTHLKLLFQLDSLATRARRHAENLVILGGQQPGRRWSRPVPLVDVVRGATGETVNYEQVLVRRIPEVSIAADKAADVIHIVAELIDNATSFGPPGSTVELRGEIVGKGLVLEVEDRGLGMPAEQRDELNRQLLEVPDFADMALSADTRLGLFVVGRLAARHEIRVTLRESASYGGTVAVILLPTAVLVEPLTPIAPVSGAFPLPGTGPLRAMSGPAVRPPGT